MTYHASLATASSALTTSLAGGPPEFVSAETAAGAGGAQPTAMKSALVRSSGNAIKSRMLKIIAKMIEPTAAGYHPSSFHLLAFLRGIGNSRAQRPSPPSRASPLDHSRVSATRTSSASASVASRSFVGNSSGFKYESRLPTRRCR